MGEGARCARRAATRRAVSPRARARDAARVDRTPSCDMAQARRCIGPRAAPAPHAPEPVGRLRHRPRRRGRRRGRHASRPAEPHAEVGRPRGSRRRAPGAPRRYVTLEPCSHHGRTAPVRRRPRRRRRRPCRRRARGPRSQGRGRGDRAAPRRRRDRRGRRRRGRAPRRSRPYLHHRRTGRAVLRRQDGDEPRRPHRRRRRLVAVDHRRGGARRRARAARRLAGRRGRRRHRARRSPDAHGPRASIRLRSSASRCACCSTHGAGSRPTGRCSTPTLAPTLVVTTDAAPPAAVDAWRAAGAKVEVVAGGTRRRRRPRGDARAARPRRRAAGAGRGRRRRVHGALLARRARRPARRLRRRRAARSRRAPAFDGSGPATLADAPASAARRAPLGDDVRLDYDPVRRPGPRAGGA